MGKKSKRSNRKDRSVGDGRNVPLIIRRLIKLQKESFEDHQNRLYSEAANKYRQGLQIIQEIHTTMLQNAISIDSHLFEMKASLSLNLIMVEYSHCRFNKVIQLCNDTQSLPENEKQVLSSFMCKVHGELAMLRLDDSTENKKRVVSLINDHISEGMTPDEVVKALEAVMILRNMKEYDTAMALGRKLEELSNDRDIATFQNSREFVGLIGDFRDIVTFEIAVSYLERYRVEYHQQTRKVSRNNSLDRVMEAFDKISGVPTKALSQRYDAYFIMLAQRDYLCHQVDDKDLSVNLCDSAIKNVERYLKAKWHFERDCFTCFLKGTATEVQLVCSGCQVACYCSLDHQRMTWKKDAIIGMRIGHEILCPLMKAYRKWKLVSKKGNERALKLRRRFDRECLYFLSHGLDLKDKCFQEKDAQKFLSLQN